LFQNFEYELYVYFYVSFLTLEKKTLNLGKGGSCTKEQHMDTSVNQSID